MIIHVIHHCTFLLDVLCQDDESVKVEDDVRRRSYNEPTLEDKFDKTQMPKPMQVAPLHTYTNIYGVSLTINTLSRRDPHISVLTLALVGLRLARMQLTNYRSSLLRVVPYSQVKNFGRSGQTKWTHLANEDTTQWDSAWAQETHLATKMQHKMSGVGNIDAAFKRRKKKDAE